MKNIPLYEVRDVRDIKDLFNESCRIYGDKSAFMMKKNSNKYENISYNQAKIDVDCLGTALHSLGLKGKRIVVIGENRYEWALSYLAVVTGTGVVVPLDRQLPIMEIENCIGRADVGAVIYSSKIEETINIISEKFDNIEYFICMDDLNENGKYKCISKLIERGKKDLENSNNSFIEAKIDIEEMSSLLFTSGTTSNSKAVMLSQMNIVSNVTEMCKMVDINDKDIFLSILPLHHSYECTCGFLTPIYRGATIAYCEGLRHIQKNMQEAHVTMMLGVPLIFETIYKKIWERIDKKGKTQTVKFMIKVTNLPGGFGKKIKKKLFKEIHDQLGGNIKTLVAGAAAFSKEVSKGYRDFGILAIQGYGLTECSPIVAVNRDVDYMDGAAGLAIPNTEIKIDNPNSEGVGEIITSGYNIMMGYYQDEEATNNALKNGWFYTGDLGYIDAKGFVYITGRKKNVIITKNGKNVYPEEIETMLNNCPYIKESLVYGKDENVDTAIYAKVVLNNEYIEEAHKNNPLNKEALNKKIWEEIKEINKDLVVYKHIKGFEIKEKEFEKTTTMKIKRYLES